MIVVTGAAGFIGSVLVGRLNAAGFENLVLVDDFSKVEKEKNLQGKSFAEKIHRDDFFQWFDTYPADVEMVLHIGARTDTTEFDKNIFDILNLNYSKQIWLRCAELGIPMIYASSAATYGMG
jgi:ADP-L-glycero-D-manno-heptose 6-epimerase